MKTPKAAGFRFPAEWQPHTSTWLSWPHNKDSWPGKIGKVYQPYSEFIKAVAQGELVNINVADSKMEAFAKKCLAEVKADFNQIKFHHHPTNDAWCRDHGPSFVINANEKAIVNWRYNAWGGKYPPFDLDNQIPRLISEKLGLKLFEPEIIIEG
jgi:agmatine deiminase